MNNYGSLNCCQLERVLCDILAKWWPLSPAGGPAFSNDLGPQTLAATVLFFFENFRSRTGATFFLMMEIVSHLDSREDEDVRFEVAPSENDDDWGVRSRPGSDRRE